MHIWLLVIGGSRVCTVPPDFKHRIGIINVYHDYFISTRWKSWERVTDIGDQLSRDHRLIVRRQHKSEVRGVDSGSEEAAFDQTEGDVERLRSEREISVLVRRELTACRKRRNIENSKPMAPICKYILLHYSSKFMYRSLHSQESIMKTSLVLSTSSVCKWRQKDMNSCMKIVISWFGWGLFRVAHLYRG